MLPEELDKKFEDEMAEFEEERRMEYVTGIERRAIQRGLQQGLQQGLGQGAASIVLRQLQRRLGELKPSVVARIEAMPLEKLEQLSEALLDFTSTKDLNRWLRDHAPARRKTKAR